MDNQERVKSLLDAGVHFGHLTRKWDPNMSPYIYMERNGIHIINLYKTVAKMDEASRALRKLAASGRQILFVATKKQAKDIVAKSASDANMPYITERWPGGMLTNFVTIRRAVKKMDRVDRMKKDGRYDSLSKKERLQVDRMRAKLEKNLGSISEMSRLPAALFIVDTVREHIAVNEAQKLGIPIFAMVDTNANPRDVDFAIPANDDASRSIEAVSNFVSEALQDGLKDRAEEKQREKEAKEAEKKAKEEKKRKEKEEKEAKEKAKKEAEEKKKAEEKQEAKDSDDKKDKSEDKKEASDKGKKDSNKSDKASKKEAKSSDDSAADDKK